MTTLTSPHDLLSAIPFVVGFKPENSIILISVKEDSVSMAMRIDFPPSLDELQIEQLISHLERDRAEAILAVFYTTSLFSDSHEVIATLMKALEDQDLKLRESLVVSGGRWRSLMVS